MIYAEAHKGTVTTHYMDEAEYCVGFYNGGGMRPHPQELKTTVPSGLYERRVSKTGQCRSP
jgi:hypothetical protein